MFVSPAACAQLPSCQPTMVAGAWGCFTAHTRRQPRSTPRYPAGAIMALLPGSLQCPRACK